MESQDWDAWEWNIMDEKGMHEIDKKINDNSHMPNCGKKDMCKDKSHMPDHDKDKKGKGSMMDR